MGELLAREEDEGLLDQVGCDSYHSQMDVDGMLTLWFIDAMDSTSWPAQMSTLSFCPWEL